MTCTNCGAHLENGAKFCTSCGTTAAKSGRFCSSCGSEMAPNAKFCPKCGTEQKNAADVPSNDKKNTAAEAVQTVVKAAETAKKLLEHTSNASAAPGEMRISMDKVGGEGIISIIRGIIG